MLQYIVEVIVWTIIIYTILELVKIIIYKFVISSEKIKELNTNEYIKCKTIGENKKAK